jgi:hypothetical protein
VEVRSGVVGARRQMRCCGREADSGHISHCLEGDAAADHQMFGSGSDRRRERRWLLVFQNEEEKESKKEEVREVGTGGGRQERPAVRPPCLGFYQ